MLKRTRTAVFDAWREYELVHGQGSAFWDSIHAALIMVAFWVVFGHAASQTLPFSPRVCHNSSAICGANGAITITKFFNKAAFLHFC